MSDVSHGPRAQETSNGASPAGRSTGNKWYSLFSTAAVALVVFTGADLLARRAVPLNHLSEASDGVAALSGSHPETVVLGSSHARTFEAVDRVLSGSGAATRRIVAIPIEYGKLSSYEWLLDHRILPLIDRHAEGANTGPAVKRFVLITEWWDSCAPIDGQFVPNIPARAWTLGDFITDLSAHGLTDYNRTYLAEQWRQLFQKSALMEDRGYGRLWLAGRERLRPTPPATEAAAYEHDVAAWQNLIEKGDRCIADPTQMRAFTNILDSLASRHLDVTVLLYPRKPATLSAQGKATTLAHWSRIADSVATVHHARFVDLTDSTPLTDSDFARDFDHVTPTGNILFAKWALAGPLAFLADSGASRTVAP